MRLSARSPFTRSLLASSVALGTVGAAAFSLSAPASAETSRGVEIPAFYNAPASVPATPGTLIRSEPMPLAVNLPVVFPGKATRMMYSSIDSSGKPVAVTGAYIQSTKPWTGSGPRPVVAFAVGTIGQGDQCAPSYGLEHPVVLGIGSDGNTFGINYDMTQMSTLLNQGYSIALTDYVGLGATDRLHTYVNRVDQGHALLDAARAVRSLGMPANTPIGAWGYSQGGGAAASAAELQPGYAPDVPLKGAYAGAPPADLATTLKGIDGNLIAGVIGYSLNGFAQSYPQIRPVIDANINAAGRAALQDISTQCIGDTISSYAFRKTSSWTTSGKSMSDIIAANPAAKQVLDEQRIGRSRPAAPVLVTSDVGDGTVPHPQVRQLAVDWCAKGANVTYTPFGLPDPTGDKAAIHHLAGMVEGLPGALSWMKGRLAGQPVQSGCGKLPLQP
ncbi:lipase family protein [Flexivirga meconopsidis]|uniref:lipase family protein n=1 Tax=Flexivirga meconopsidis TaxID=2977121 RepID=UPI002240D31D|nr:lipase family protein [Flexivirga meconopsidis]